MKRTLQKFLSAATAAALSVSLANPASARGLTGAELYAGFVSSLHLALGQEKLAGTVVLPFLRQTGISRGMFYTALHQLTGYPADNQQATNLADVPEGQWFTGSVIWAVTSGIASCESADRFGTDSPVTRVELCQAIFRFDRHSGLNRLNRNAITTFPDLGQLNGEQRAAVAACQDAGLLKASDDGRFDPYARAMSAEAGEILQRYNTLTPHSDPEPNPTAAQTEDDLLPASGVSGWSGSVEHDFPLSASKTVTAEQVLDLNSRILYENLPAKISPLGTTLDGNEKHLTNYGSGGTTDCVNVATNRLNKNNEVDAGVALNGAQEYYGYSLQVDGLARQDRWHEDAEDSGKDPWQCTWWVWGRAAQYLEEAKNLDFRAVCDGEDNFGHGKSYYHALSDYFKSDQTPSPNSIVSWSAGRFGHVAYVEAVDEGGIYVSMADSGHSWRGVTYIRRTDSKKNPYPLYWYESETLNGFNHLDEPLND